MKTIFRILACYLAVSLILPSVTAEENQHTIDEAEYALQEFMSQSGWNDYVVEDYYVLYDADIEEYGYIFKLSNDSFLGYAIAVEAPNGYHIAEASKNCVFPYDGYEDEYLLIYTTSFGYYAISDTMPLSIQEHLINTKSGSVINKNAVLIRRFEPSLNTIQGRYDPYRTDVYINNYSSWFEPAVQGTSNGCVPWSMAMALKYLHNRGRITLSITNVNSIGYTLYDLMGGSPDASITVSNTISGLSSFGNLYCNRSLSTNGNGFWPVSFSTVKGEIDSNYPLALMFNSGILYGVRHSTTMVGYSVITYSGTPANYVIVRDPGTSGVPELYLSWNSTNIHGYYLIYVG